MRPARNLFAVALVATAFAVSASVSSADDDTRAARLATLRSENAGLQEQLAEQRESLSVELRALQAQRVDLEVQVRREEVQVAELLRELEALRSEAGEDDSVEEALRPVIVRVVAQLDTSVRSGLPYRVEDRLAALRELEVGLEAREIRPSKALGRLWAFVEDELRLTRENVVDRQVVPLTSGDTLAEVARLGMTTMFFRTTDGRTGFVAAARDGWRWELVDDADGKRRIEGLFDSISKGIRVGWFEIPWAFGEVPR
jgi:hypothetical protein